MDNPQTLKQLVKFHWDCGRMGDIEGLFVTTQAALEAAYGQTVAFGEVLGKHSDIHGKLDREDISLVTEDQDFIEKLLAYVGGDVSGFNPLNYLGE